MVDLIDQVGQRVLRTAPWDPADPRFRKVDADGLRDALDLGRQQQIALAKLERVQAGETAVMSDRELDWWIEWELHPTDVASIPNPQRCGLLDIYIVAKSSHPTIRNYRLARG
jgi:hypothetical protein